MQKVFPPSKKWSCAIGCSTLCILPLKSGPCPVKLCVHEISGSPIASATGQLIWLPRLCQKGLATLSATPTTVMGIGPIPRFSPIFRAQGRNHTVSTPTMGLCDALFELNYQIPLVCISSKLAARHRLRWDADLPCPHGGEGLGDARRSWGDPQEGPGFRPESLPCPLALRPLACLRRTHGQGGQRFFQPWLMPSSTLYPNPTSPGRTGKDIGLKPWIATSSQYGQC